jgi:cleavage and polyadenylation specificity factor subunit 1
VAAVRLKDQTTGTTVPLLAVGAALPAGEDYPCGGRLLLFEVARDAAGQWAGRQVYSREFRGPVTGLAGLEGYLLLASGNRIETCVLSSSTLTTTADDGTVTADTSWKLTRSAFYDGPVLLTSLNVVKNFVLLGDCQHSVQFVRYRDEVRWRYGRSLPAA